MKTSVLARVLVAGLSTALLANAQNWPSFRGPDATGIADGENLPLEFGGEDMTHVLWQTEIPGLAHSSPIVWGDRIYLTTAVSSGDRAELVTGSSASAGISSADDRVAHRWLLIALDKHSGEILWEQTAHEGTPRIGRHQKASHASATPATNGERIVALMGSEGLYCFDMDGELLWSDDLGLMDVGLWGSDDPGVQWGPGSSPIIYENLVIVQNDRQSDSFLAAYDLETGDEVWRVSRDEKPVWSTPVIYRGERSELVTNGANYARGYNPLTGDEYWRMSNNDLEVMVPSPVVSGGTVVITGGYPTGANPVKAVRLGANGDITLADGQSSNEGVIWSSQRGSPYTPTPLVYRGIVYSLVDNGVLNVYDLQTGDELYRTRVAVGAAFSASPVAADGNIYLASEDGVVYVMKAGSEFELLAENELDEVLMASPAISDGMMIVRGRDHVFGIGLQDQ